MTLFETGTIDITPTAKATLDAAGTDVTSYLSRHQSGDWGDVDEDMQRDNNFALHHRQILCSRYYLDEHTALQLITSGDRSLTQVMLASEQPVQKVNLQKGYALWASTYDSEKNALIAVEELYANDIIASLPVKTALDVGTGTGRHALRMAQRGIDVTALDQSADMLAVAQRAAQERGLDIHFRLASLENNLPFKQGTFDFVLCALMLDHVPDLAHAIQEFFRVLQPGGYLLITDFHPDSIQRGWRTQLMLSDVKYLLPNSPHTRDDYMNGITHTGFHILKTIDAIVDEAPEGYVSDAFRSANRDKTFCLIILAQKPL